jgi:threonine/homoserine/homoserine lactone efflux protein
VIGLLASLPMGPIGVLCVQRTLKNGRYSGFFSGMGAATADTLFAIIAGLGVNYIIGFVEKRELFFQFIGAAIIILIGLKIYSTNTVKQFRIAKSKKGTKFTKDYFSVLFLTLTNPMIIFLFVWMFAGLNIVLNTSDYILSSLIILGIFIGANLWWFTLSGIVNKFRNNLKIRRLYWFNKISGGIILIFGILTLLKILIFH